MTDVSCIFERKNRYLYWRKVWRVYNNEYIECGYLKISPYEYICFLSIEKQLVNIVYYLPLSYTSAYI